MASTFGRRTELLTPFGASLALPIVSDGLAAAFADAGSLLERIEMRSVGGEVYQRVVPVGAPPDAKGGPPPWWVLGALVRIVPQGRARCRAARRAVNPHTIDTLVRTWTKQWRPEIVEATARLRDLDPGAMSDAELAAHLDDAIALTRRGLEMHFRLIPAYGLALHDLVTTCRELMGWDALRTLDLVAGLSEATSKPARALAAIAARAGNPARALQVLSNPTDDVCTRLHEVDPLVATAFDAWRETYAWRVLGEDPGAPTLAEQPALLAGLLRDALQQPHDFDEVDGRRKIAIERARSRLAGRSAVDRDRFEDALHVASRVYPTREDSALRGGSHPAGLIRRALLEIGRRLVQTGELDRPDDIAMLDAGTVQAAVRGAARQLRDKVALARSHQAWVRAHPGPAFYGPPPGAMPDVRGLPAAARRMNAALMWIQAQQRTIVLAA